MVKKTLQFELWEECDNCCKFCYNSSGKFCTSDELKIKSLQLALDKISNDNIIKDYNVLSYIGGEFFQGQLKNEKVKELFLKLMKKTADLYNSHKISEIWLNATLTKEIQDCLYETLNMYNDYQHIWICTSYDTIGRFHTSKLEENWRKNMHQLQDTYNDIKFNVSIILTGDFLTKYLENKFNIAEFEREFHSTTFFKTPSTGSMFPDQTIKDKETFNNTVLNNFFPTRKQMLQFLTRYKNEVPNFIYDKLYNINYRADDLYKNVTKNQFDNTHFKRVKDKQMLDYKQNDNDNTMSKLAVLKCGHRTIYSPYVDSDSCFICDKELIASL